MKEKLRQVMDKIISDPTKMGEVIKHENEYYFTYGKYFFSIMLREPRANSGKYVFYLYPDWKGKLPGLVNVFANGNPDEAEILSLSEKPEDPNGDKFQELHALVRSKYLNLDKIFSDLLGD